MVDIFSFFLLNKARTLKKELSKWVDSFNKLKERGGEMSEGKKGWTPPAMVAERYEIRGEIGNGGMGVVFRGYDRNLERDVAIKFMDPAHVTNEEAVSRFQREAFAAGKIGHENICDVRDRGMTEDGAPFIVMELLEGEPLSKMKERTGRVEPDRAVEIVSQVLSALEATHAAGIIHRDIKPENIFLALGAGGHERVKLFDFGTALMGDDPELRVTKAGHTLGTPHYMSPEQARGQDDIDHRTDLWSVGVVLYEMLTGELPFKGRNYNEVLAKILVAVAPPDPLEVDPDLPRELGDVVLHAMAVDRDRRFFDAAEFAAALNAKDDDLEKKECEDGGVPPKVRKWLRPAVIIIIIAAVLLLGASTGVFLVRWYSPSSPVSATDASPPLETSVASPNASADGDVDADADDGEEVTKTVEVAPPPVPVVDASIPDVSPEKTPPDAEPSEGRRRRKRGASPQENGGLQRVLTPEEPRILPPPITPLILPPPTKRGEGGVGPPKNI